MQSLWVADTIILWVCATQCTVINIVEHDVYALHILFSVHNINILNLVYFVIQRSSHSTRSMAGMLYDKQVHHHIKQ